MWKFSGLVTFAHVEWWAELTSQPLIERPQTYDLSQKKLVQIRLKFKQFCEALKLPTWVKCKNTMGRMEMIHYEYDDFVYPANYNINVWNFKFKTFKNNYLDMDHSWPRIHPKRTNLLQHGPSQWIVRYALIEVFENLQTIKLKYYIH